MAEQYVAEQRRVFDGAGESTDMVELLRQGQHTGAGNLPVGRFEADDAAERSGTNHRSVGL